MQQIRDIFYPDDGLSVEAYAERYRQQFLRRMARKYLAKKRALRHTHPQYLG